MFSLHCLLKYHSSTLISVEWNYLTVKGDNPITSQNIKQSWTSFKLFSELKI